jgi:hypothetical protein
MIASAQDWNSGARNPARTVAAMDPGASDASLPRPGASSAAPGDGQSNRQEMTSP